MKKFFVLLALVAGLSGCYGYVTTPGIGIAPTAPVYSEPAVVYPEYYYVAPVCCNVWFGGRWHHSHHHWNHGHRRGWHYRHHH